MDIVFRSLALIASGMIVLRLAGRKSISQMSIVQTVIMISIGNLIVQPIANRSVWRAIVSSIIFVAFTILVEYLQLKYNYIEKLMTGESKLIILNGQLLTENLKKMRLTVDQVEMRLRQSGIKSLSDVKTATIEPNGQLGYELTADAQPLTVGQFKSMLAELRNANVIQVDNTNESKLSNQVNEYNNLFSEVISNQHKTEIPKDLH